MSDEPSEVPEATSTPTTPEIPEIIRRTVPVPGGSCNIRLGHSAIDYLGSAIAAIVGRPQRAVLVSMSGADADLVELTRRQLTAQGFHVSPLVLDGDGAVRDLAHASLVFDALGAAGATSDDALVVVGDVDLLSLCAFVAHNWCAGLPMAGVATDVLAATESVLTPRALDLGGLPERIGARCYSRVLVCDLDRMDLSPDGPWRLAMAMMVATAASDSERSFSVLAGRAADIVVGDADVLGEQLLDSMKSRGRLACSNSIAIRQSLDYGVTFARALADLAPELEPANCLAEGLRFSSRLAVSACEGDVDFVFMQDALLDRLGLPEVAVEVDPDELAERLRAVRFETSNRFLLALPEHLGKVRLASVSDEDLAEHLGAWAASRAALAKR